MKISLIISFLVLNAGLTLAQFDQGGHLHGGQMEMLVAPHGGQLEDLGKYKVELVANLYQKENQLMFYLFKGEMKPVSTSEITGKITLLYDDGRIVSQDLTPVGDEFFVGQLNGTESYQCTVEFTIKKKTIVTVYTHIGMGAGVVYTCSMHPQIRNEDPGACSICGMDLIPIEEKQVEKKQEKVHNHSH